MRSFYVYILAKHRHGALYVGMTNDLVRRDYEHREGRADGFTKRYGIKQLVYFEQHATAVLAISREKTILGPDGPSMEFSKGQAKKIAKDLN